ncbi:MAG: hypothetical protein WB681_04950 [Candidatus Cybelea sp.]
MSTFVPPNPPWRLCSDSSGNVWAPSHEVVYEYAHGGTSPIQTLNAQGLFMSACAVDPTTGNLAVIGNGRSSGTFILAIWAKGQGTPTTYALPFVGSSVTYDDSGNLFVDGNTDSQSFLFAELPKGGSTFQNVTLDRPARWPGNLQWDGNYLALATLNLTEPQGQKHLVYRVKVSGSSGHVVKTIVFKHELPFLGSWIYANTLIGVLSSNENNLAFWHYPTGGKPFQKLTGFTDPLGITVSVAPPRSRIRK